MLYKTAIRALNTTINESYWWVDSSIVLTWIQVPPNKWKTSLGHNVDMIQEETSSAIWRYVPTQSNLTDFIQEELSQQCYQHPHHAERDHTGHYRSHQASLQRSSALLDTWKSEMYMLHFYNF